MTEVDLPDPGHDNGEAQSKTQFSYDTSTGQMASMTDSTGPTSFSYNAFRGLTTITGPDGATNQLNAALTQALINTSGGVGTAANPAPLVYANNLVGSQTDENAHTSTFLPGRLGSMPAIPTR